MVRAVPRYSAPREEWWAADTEGAPPTGSGTAAGKVILLNVNV
jgi:hypothetical protein